MIKLKELTKEIFIPDNMRVKMSDKLIVLDKSKTYEQELTIKPVGFWYGFGNEWIDWVRSEMPHWEGEYLYEVDISHSNVLQIKSYGDFILLDKKYRSFNEYNDGTFIDWSMVSKEYDGIEINPYQHEARFNYIWYYSWDVASGCIWNLRQVELKLIEGPKV